MVIGLTCECVATEDPHTLVGVSLASQPNIGLYYTAGVLMKLTWYDRSPWADVFINNVFSTLPSSDGRKISLKDAFPLGGITWERYMTENVILTILITILLIITWEWGAQMETYSSVKGRYVKMPAGCKHWQQCHRNFLAGVVYIYGFSSWQPQRPVKTDRATS